MSDQIMTLMNKPLQTGTFKGMKFDSMRVFNLGNANLYCQWKPPYGNGDEAETWRLNWGNRGEKYFQGIMIENS